MIVILILVIAFIAITLFLGFANEEPEIKVAGLTFFISLFTVGPFFSGLLSIPAPVPLSPDNHIEVVSILVAAVMSAIALGIYKVIEEIKYRARERKRTEKLGYKKGHELDAYKRIAEGGDKHNYHNKDEDDNVKSNIKDKRYLQADVLEISILELDHFKYNGYENLHAVFGLKNNGAISVCQVNITMDVPLPEKEGYVEMRACYREDIRPGQTVTGIKAYAGIIYGTVKKEATKCLYDYRFAQVEVDYNGMNRRFTQPDEYGFVSYSVDKNNRSARGERISSEQLYWYKNGVTKK